MPQSLGQTATNMFGLGTGVTSAALVGIILTSTFLTRMRSQTKCGLMVKTTRFRPDYKPTSYNLQVRVTTLSLKGQKTKLPESTESVTRGHLSKVEVTKTFSVDALFFTLLLLEFFRYSSLPSFSYTCLLVFVNCLYV